MPMLVHAGEAAATGWCPTASCAPPTSTASSGETNNPEWKTVAYRRDTGKLVVPQRLDRLPLGREAASGIWRKRTAQRQGGQAAADAARRQGRALPPVGFPYFGGREHEHFAGTSMPTCSCATCRSSASRWQTARTCWSPRCSTCWWPTTASIAASAASTSPSSYDDDVPYTPAWAEKITGVPRDQIITVAREFADNADKTHGKSMVIIGAAMNHWYHMRHELPRHHQHADDVRLHRPVAAAAGRITSGQEKLRPQTGWTPLAFALDWSRPPRQMNSHLASSMRTPTSGATRRCGVDEILSPTAPTRAVGRQR